MRKYLGILIFILLFTSIISIILFSEDSKEITFHTTFSGFVNLNDFFSSLFILIGFSIAFLIYLSNQDIISNKFLLSYIHKIPDFVPFKHALEKYLSKLVKKEVRIIVLIRPIDKNNHEWVLNQISAYNYIMQSPAFTDYKEKIQFLFIKNNQADIEHLVSNLDLAHYNYILLSGLSATFKSAILSREKLQQEEKDAIQIIGSLSSINDKYIQEIIDKDNNIIRIFPPDYDEAKTAMGFMFSKIKNSICPVQGCKLHNQEHNIIIIHNGTYGNAIRKQCEVYFHKEFSSLDIHTSNQISARALSNSIKFHSYNYKNTDTLICDKTRSETFISLLSEIKNHHNHFYIIGYEPNISNIISHLDKSFKTIAPERFSLLFAGTTSMDSWRKTIIETLSNTHTLKHALTNSAYYMKLYTLRNIDKFQQASINMDLKLEHYNPTATSLEADLIEELRTLFPNRHINEHTNRLNTFWKNENNYITTFISYSLRIADYSIKNDTTLLESKFKVLRESGRETEILVNGDSINQYTIKFLEAT